MFNLFIYIIIGMLWTFYALGEHIQLHGKDRVLLSAALNFLFWPAAMLIIAVDWLLG